MRRCEISHMSYALLMHLWLTTVFTLSAPPFDVINFFIIKRILTGLKQIHVVVGYDEILTFALIKVLISLI